MFARSAKLLLTLGCATGLATSFAVKSQSARLGGCAYAEDSTAAPGSVIQTANVVAPVPAPENSLNATHELVHAQVSPGIPTCKTNCRPCDV